MLADGNGDFADAVGLAMDGSKFGMGKRSQRYSMIVNDGVVEQLNVEAPGEYRASSAETYAGPARNRLTVRLADAGLSSPLFAARLRNSVRSQSFNGSRAKSFKEENRMAEQQSWRKQSQAQPEQQPRAAAISTATGA